jgi:hypothetical protein
MFITDLEMWVKTPPLRRQLTPYLSTSSKLGILQNEAGSRAQSEAKQIVTLVLKGRCYGETRPKKESYSEAAI